MSDCKDCNCTMKYINKLFNNNMKNMKNSKNILCKKNNVNIKYLLPIEFMFYFTSFGLLSYYNYNKNKRFSYI
mgnify:CR=1 FL=1